MTESYLGRGYDDVAGQPFGYAWHKERDEIHNHLMRGKRAQMYVGLTMKQRIDAIQTRIHRNKPNLQERQAARLACQPKRLTPPSFTDDELMHLIELFNHANDPISKAIALKAAEMLQLTLDDHRNDHY